MVQAFALLTIASQSLSPFDFSHGGMHTYPEHIEGCEQGMQLVGPILLFDDVFNQEVQTHIRKSRYRVVKAVEECLSPSEACLLIDGTKSLVGELVRRIEMELRFERRAKSLRES